MSGAYATVNDAPVIEAVITRPRVGVWHADLVVDDVDAANYQGQVSIDVGDGDLKLSGTAFRSGHGEKKLVQLRVKAGAGGLDTVVSPKAYQNAPVRIALSDILQAAGEQLAASADAGVLGANLSKWIRMQQPAGFALMALLKAAGAGWRFLSDGTLWVGPESWPSSRLEYEITEDDPHLGRWEIASDSLALDPGSTLAGNKVSTVEHRISGERIRTLVWFEDGTAAEDRTMASLMAVIRSAFPSIDALALYPAKVNAQNSDLTLELTVDDARFPGLSNVPLRVFVPGATVKVAAGARVLVSFAGGDPQQPIALLWETGTLSQLIIACSDIQLGGGTQEKAALGESLSSFLTSLRSTVQDLFTQFNAHTHVVAAAPGTSAPPLPVATVAPPSVPTLTSNSVKVKT